MGITKAQANARLRSITTADGLRRLIREIDTTGSGDITLLWSGSAADYTKDGKVRIHSEEIAASLRHANQDFRTIATTEAAKFLNISKGSADFNQQLYDKLKAIFKGNDQKILDFLYGPQDPKTKMRTAKGAWDDVSENFVKQAKGDVRLLVGGASIDRVFAITELRALLSNQAVTSVEGISRESLRQLERISGTEKVFRTLAGLSEASTGMIKIEVDADGLPKLLKEGIYKVDASDYMRMNTLNSVMPSGMKAVYDFISPERRMRHRVAVEEIFKLRRIMYVDNQKLPQDHDHFKHRFAVGRVIRYTGLVGEAVDMTLMLRDAGKKLNAGDHRGAHDTVTSWFLQAGGSFLGGRLASVAVAPLMATGPVGMALGACIIIGASVIGGEMAKKLISGKKDLIKRKLIIINLTISPLALDLNGDGIQTLSLADNFIHFDHDKNGFAERTGWIDPNDGLLTLDLNGNGKIDNGGELFGNYTKHGTMNAVNGFLALGMYDTNLDRQIDRQDRIWNDLRVWRDQNSDGISDNGELFTLESLNIKTLHLHYTSSTYVDSNGNAHKQQGAYIKTNGQIAALTDVWFLRDASNSLSSEIREVDPVTASLPDLPEMGIVPSLHQALMNPERGALRETFTKWLGATRLQRKALNQELLFEWCDADNNPFVSPKRFYVSSDPDIQQKVAVVEKLRGQIVDGSERIFGDARAELIQSLVKELEFYLDMILSAQVHVYPLYDLGLPLDTDTDSPLQMNLSNSVAHLRSQFQKDPDPGFIPMVQWLLAHDEASGRLFFDELKREATKTNDALGIAMRAHGSITKPWEWIVGTPESDQLRGTAVDEFMESGHEMDFLWGQDGNDTLHGGPANDFYYGGIGGDTYIVSQNQNGEFDIIFDEGSDLSGPPDRILFWNVNSTDVDVHGSENITLMAGATTLARITGQMNPQNRIEEFHFADGVIWSHDTLLQRLPIEGTPLNDRLVGRSGIRNRLHGLMGNDTLTGAALADLVEGNEGNDWLTGLAGMDTLNGGPGNDMLIGGEGGDFYIFTVNSGHDTIRDIDSRTQQRDQVVFTGVPSTALTRVQRTGQTLRLHFGASTSLTLIDHLNASSRIESFTFSDGTIWDHTRLLQQVS